MTEKTKMSLDKINELNHIVQETIDIMHSKIRYKRRAVKLVNKLEETRDLSIFSTLELNSMFNFIKGEVDECFDSGYKVDPMSIHQLDRLYTEWKGHMLFSSISRN